MIFDDGSTLDYDTGTVTGSPAGMLATDYYEAVKMNPYTHAAQGSVQPWWENVVQYGITRAIDNRYGPPTFVQGNVAPGSFAGQNGASYYQNPTAVRNGVVAGGQTVLSGSPLILIGMAALAFFALRG